MEQSTNVCVQTSGGTPPVAESTPDPPTETSGPHAGPEPNWLSDGVDVIRATRSWVQYGIVGFTILCIVIGAVEALFGR